VSNTVVHSIPTAHNGFEPTTVAFSNNGKYLLTAGKDGTIRLWEMSTGTQLQLIVAGPQWKNRLQVTFNHTEEYIISTDETSYAAIVWSARTGELLQRLTGHTSVIPWVAASPVEGCLMTCSNDFRARFWVQEPQ